MNPDWNVMAGAFLGAILWNVLVTAWLFWRKSKKGRDR